MGHINQCYSRSGWLLDTSIQQLNRDQPTTVSTLKLELTHFTIKMVTGNVGTMNETKKFNAAGFVKLDGTP